MDALALTLCLVVCDAGTSSMGPAHAALLLVPICVLPAGAQQLVPHAAAAGAAACGSGSTAGAATTGAGLAVSSAACAAAAADAVGEPGATGATAA